MRLQSSEIIDRLVISFKYNTHYFPGICSMDLRKLIPTDDTRHFLDNFCNSDGALTIHERCFILRCDEKPVQECGRRPYVDVEMCLRYVGLKTDSNIQVIVLFFSLSW